LTDTLRVAGVFPPATFSMSQLPPEVVEAVAVNERLSALVVIRIPWAGGAAAPAW
jgi:hypothetical protein